jgi:hypothetical protein
MFIILFLLCSKDYNPFSDSENCEIHIISKSFTDTDTLTIFSTETVSVLLTVPGFVKSFIVESPENRYFENGSKQFISPGSGPHVVLFSFWDTGLVSIRFSLERTSGEKKDKEINCLVRSPLKNSTVKGGFDSLNQQYFKTEAVSDKGITYQWVFDDCKEVEQIQADTAGLFVDGINDTGTGLIYVTDGKYISPASSFRYQFEDVIPPQLKFLDQGEVRSDTLICNGNAFYKNMKITDPGSGKVEEVKINGTSETEKYTIIKKFQADSGRISIYLRDGSPNGNDTTIYYYVKIDSAASGNDGNLQFKILFPRDRDTFNTGLVNVFTQVEYLDKQKLYHILGIKVNNNLVDSIDISENYFSQKTFSVTTPLPENKIQTVLYDRYTGAAVDSCQIITFYDPTYQKDAKPVILDVQFVNTRVSRGQIIAKSDSVDVRVIAFDDKGRVEKVLLNSTSLVCEKNGYQWSGKVQIPGKYNKSSIVAVDSAGNHTDTLFEIVKNSLPVFMKTLKKKVQLAVGEIYRDTMHVSDADNDLISYTITNNAEKNITIGSHSGVIEWKPSIADSNGNGYHFTFSASDNYDEILDSVVLFVFKDSSFFIAPVGFKTKSSEISSIIESGLLYKYTLELQKGVNGVSFEFRTDMDSVRIAQDTLILKPQLNDTGYHKVTLIAINKLDLSDTLYTDFIVTLPNRKPSFSDSVFNIDGKPGITVIGTIDSFISFPLSISDPDSADKNEINISFTCKLSNAQVSLMADNFYELKLFNSNKNVKEDTIILFCEDHGGLRDTLIIPIHYIKKIFPVEYITPGNGELLMQDTVWFRWSNATDVAGVINTLQIDGMDEAVKLNDTTAYKKIMRSDTYHWRVITICGKDSVVGEWRSFSIRVPGHIQFKTTENEMKKYCFAGVDTYSMQLEIKEGTGSAVNKFKAVMRRSAIDSMPIPITDNGKLIWIPKDSDTGIYDLDIFAYDSVWNSDTLSTHLSVVSASSCVINAFCADTSLYCENAVDLYGDVKETQLFIGLTRSGKTVFDTFTIKVTSRGYSANLDADSVTIHLKRPDTLVADDSLVIVVHNKNLTLPPVTKVILLRYNIPTRIVKITTSQLNLTRGLSDVPVLLRLDDKNIGFARKNGFRFLTKNNSDTLDYQVNSWNEQARTIEVWVRFDTISSTGDDTCVMQYGYQLPDKSDGGMVFDTMNNFKGVYHFEEIEKELVVNDATSGENVGMFNNNRYDISNGIGSSILLQEGNGTKFTISKNMVFGEGEEKTFTIESWVKRLQAVNSINFLFTVKIRDSLQCGLLIENGAIKAYYECYDSNGVRILTKGAGSPVQASEWKRVSFIVTILEKQINYITYANESKVAEGILVPPVPNISWTSGTIIFGTKGDVNPNVDNQSYNGHWDEIWISKKSRSEDWIRFMYASQKQVGSIVKIPN